LTKAIEANQMLIFKWLLDMIPRQRLPAGWHAELIKALSVANSDAAESAMRVHIRHGLDNVMRSIEHGS
jgi:DNA-binding GntR family transcriptional regulator